MSKYLKRGLAVVLAAMLLISTLTNITGLYATGRDPVSRIYNIITGNAPHTTEGYAAEAERKIAQNDYTGALEDLANARELTDDTDTLCTLWLRTAAVCVILGDDAQARIATDAAIGNDGASSQAWLLSTQLYLAEGDAENAAEAMAAYVALVPSDTASRASLAQLYEQAGRYGEAAAAYAALADEIPTEVSYKADAMRCYFEAGEYQTVVAFADEMDQNDMQPATHQMLGIALIQLDRNDEAVDELTLAIDLAGSRFYRGEALLALGRYEAAEEDFTGSIAEDYLTEYAYYCRGVCRAQLGAYESAMDDLDKAMTSDDASLIESATNLLLQLAGRADD